MSTPRWRGWLAAFAIFILGVGVGGAGATWFGARVIRHAMQNPNHSRGLADQMAERIGTDLTKKLDLTPEQSTRMKSILAESATRMKTMRAKTGSEITTELHTAFRQIAASLPPEKRANFQRAIAQRYKHLGAPVPELETKP